MSNRSGKRLSKKHRALLRKRGKRPWHSPTMNQSIVPRGWEEIHKALVTFIKNTLSGNYYSRLLQVAPIIYRTEGIKVTVRIFKEVTTIAGSTDYDYLGEIEHPEYFTKLEAFLAGCVKLIPGQPCLGSGH